MTNDPSDNAGLTQIVSLLAGLEMAIVHLINVLDQKGVVSRDEMAASFRSTAQNLSPEIHNRERVGLVLDQLARGIETSHFGGADHRQLRH